jgi:hypothetical protein
LAENTSPKRGEGPMSFSCLFLVIFPDFEKPWEPCLENGTPKVFVGFKLFVFEVTGVNPFEVYSK